MDLSILSEVMSMREHNLRTEKKILETFKKALQKFNGSNEIGEDEITGEEALLMDAKSPGMSAIICVPCSDGSSY